MKRFFAYLAFFISAADLSAQTQFQRVYGGVDSTQDGLDIKQTTDGGYIINARLTTFKSVASCEEAYLIKTNSAGIIQWSKSYEGPNCEEGRAIIQTTDGGYFYAGESKSWGYGGPNDFDVFAVKTNNAGSMMWSKDLGDVWNDGAWSVDLNTDGSYMIFGMSANAATNGYYDYYLSKMDVSGNLLWSKTYGGTFIDYGYDAEQTNDGGYIMAGASYPSQSGGGGQNFYLVKADGNGTFQWGKLFNGFADDFARSVIQTNDGGYIAVGGTQSFGAGNTDVYLVKTDSDGNLQWNKTYGGFNNDCGFTVKQTTDGGYAVAGGTNSIGSGGYDIFLLKTDNAGTTQWLKTYGGTGDEGPSGGMFFLFSNTDRDVSMIQTSDGGFALTSLAFSFAGNANVYFVKTDGSGNSGCNETNGVFTETSPTPTVTANGAQTNPVQQNTAQIPSQFVRNSLDTNVCSCTLPTAQAGSDVTICINASTTLNASGGTSYLWSNGMTTSSVTVSPTATTNYIVTVADSCGSDNDTVKVTVNPLPTVTVGSPATICPGANVTLNGTGSGTYQWSPGGQTTSSIVVSPTATSTYTFSVTNSCGTSSDSVKVTITNFIVASVSANATICTGGNATLTASGGNNYSWNTTQTINPIVVSPTANTTYSVIAYSGTCSDTASATVTVASSITASISGSTTVCSGQNFTLSASGGNNYSWSTGSTTSAITAAATAAATYSVIAYSGSCSDTASFTVQVDAPMISNPVPVSICPGASANVPAGISGGTPPYTYQWNTGATTSSITVSPTANTNYSVTVNDALGCSGSFTIPVNVFAVPSITISGNTILCTGDATTLTASGGVSYSWNTTSTTSAVTVAPSSSATYTVIGVNANGCIDTVSVSVSVLPPPVANIAGNNTLCLGSGTVLSASGGGTYAWSTGATSSSISITPSASTNYSVVVSAGSCSDTANYSVTVVPNPTANAGTSISISYGQSATLTASGGGTYSWSNGIIGATNVVTPVSTMQYCVYVTDANNCTDSSCVMVYVKPLECTDLVYLPNAFSPNGDDENEFLRVYFPNIACIKEFKIRIYNRWGEKVFESEDASFIWDGRYKGSEENSAVFAYYMHVKFANGTETDKKGNVSLIK